VFMSTDYDLCVQIQNTDKLCGVSRELSVAKKGKVHRCTGRTAHRGSRGIARLFLDHGTRRG